MLAFVIILVYDTFPKMSISKFPFTYNSVLQGKRLQSTGKGFLSGAPRSVRGAKRDAGRVAENLSVKQSRLARAAKRDAGRFAENLSVKQSQLARDAKRYARTRPLSEERRVLAIHL